MKLPIEDSTPGLLDDLKYEEHMQRKHEISTRREYEAYMDKIAVSYQPFTKHSIEVTNLLTKLEHEASINQTHAAITGN
jgi:hypothetical protein